MSTPSGFLTGFHDFLGRFERAGVTNELGDFTTSRRVMRISALAIVIGVFGAFIAWLLLRLIAFFTNLFFFQRISTAPRRPPTTISAFS